MQLTLWTRINREFEPASRPSKKAWCELIESECVPGKIIAGTPYIDAARFAATVNMNPPSARDEMDDLDLLG